MQTITASIAHINVISLLATQIWWHTYGSFLSSQQITFMLKNMYSPLALSKQMDNGHTFKLILSNNTVCGFASYSAINKQEFKIQKFYISQNYHNKGFGKMLINAIEQEMFLLGAKTILLNVNRQNFALHFYLKMGYVIYQEVNLPYHQFILNDYVMLKSNPNTK